MNSFPAVSTLRATVCLAAIGFLSLGAAEKASPEKSEAAPATRAIQSFNLDFPGGTLADLVTITGKPGEQLFNLICEQEHLGAKLPPFRLRNIHAMTLAEALSKLLQRQGLYIERTDPGTGQAIFTVLSFKNSAARSPTSFESFALAPFLDLHSIEDITSALRMAWELDGSRRPDDITIKYHPGTKLLFVSGPKEATEMARQIISRLPVGQDNRERERLGKPAAEVQRRDVRESLNDPSEPSPEKK